MPLPTDRECCASKPPCTKKASNIFAKCSRPPSRPTRGRKKRGLQFALFLRPVRLVQALQEQKHPEQRRPHHGFTALLRLPGLQRQTDSLGKLGGSRRSPSRDASCPANDRAGRQRLL